MFKELFFVNDDGEVIVNPIIWNIEEFGKIRNKYKKFELAVVEVSIIYFASDYRSDFSVKGSINERIHSIKQNLFSNRHLKLDDITVKAVEFYIKHNDTIKIRLIKSVKSALEKAISLVDTASFSELKDIKELSEIVARLPDMLEKMDALEDYVKKESTMDKGASGSGEKSIYEDM